MRRPTSLFPLIPARRGRMPAVLLAAGLILLGVAAAGCDTTADDGLYDPDVEFAPDPVISGIDPPDAALAGVDVLTITGENFSDDPARTFVYFGATPAEVVEVTPTQIRVRAPNEPTEGVAVKVSVLGAENFSNAVTYRLEAALETFGRLSQVDFPYGMTSDDAGNLYVSLFSEDVSVGIKRYAPDGTRSDYIASTFKWDGLDFDAAGYLYGARGVRALFRFLPGGGAQETWAVIDDNSVRLVAVAVDEAGNVWAGGSGSGDNLFGVSPAAEVRSSLSLPGSIRALAAHGGALYAAATDGAASAVWRIPLDAAGNPGAAAPFFDVSGNHGGAEALSLAFAPGGQLFVGTDARDPVLVVGTGGDWEVLYPGVLQPDGAQSVQAPALAWGTAPYLYLNRQVNGSTRNLFRVNTRLE